MQWEANYRAERLHHGLMMTNAVLTAATNAVPGITAIVEISIAGDYPDEKPSKWWATVTVDYVPARGGMARTNLPIKFYDFSTRDQPSAYLDREKLEKNRKELEEHIEAFQKKLNEEFPIPSGK